MIPPPIALGLILCEKVIIEEGTKAATLVSTFSKLIEEEFPTPPRNFTAFVVLTAGHGRGTMDLTVTRLETDAAVFSHRSSVKFPDRLARVRVYYRVNGCSFPAPGKYLVTLLVDGEWVAHCHLQVLQRSAGS